MILLSCSKNEMEIALSKIIKIFRLHLFERNWLLPVAA